MPTPSCVPASQLTFLPLVEDGRAGVVGTDLLRVGVHLPAARVHAFLSHINDLAETLPTESSRWKLMFVGLSASCSGKRNVAPAPTTVAFCEIPQTFGGEQILTACRSRRNRDDKMMTLRGEEAQQSRLRNPFRGSGES